MGPDRPPFGEDGIAHRSRTGARRRLLRTSAKQGCEAHVRSPRWASAALATYSGVGTRSAPCGGRPYKSREKNLKDLFRPERVFQLSAPGLPSEFPPLRTLDAYRNNLPLQPTPLIGRE